MRLQTVVGRDQRVAFLRDNLWKKTKERKKSVRIYLLLLAFCFIERSPHVRPVSADP